MKGWKITAGIIFIMAFIAIIWIVVPVHDLANGNPVTIIEAIFSFIVIFGIIVFMARKK